MHTWGRKVPPPPGIELGPPDYKCGALPTELLCPQILKFLCKLLNRIGPCISNFSDFRRLRECWTDFDQTWQETSTQRLLSSLCMCGVIFSGGGGGCSSTKMTSLTSNWLIHVWNLLFDHWTELDKTFQEESTKRPPKCYQICDVRSDPLTNMATLASDELRHFRLLLCNRRTKIEETLREASSSCPLRNVSFSCRSVNQNGFPGLWLMRHFYFSSVSTEFDWRNRNEVRDIPCDKTFPWVPNFFTLWPWPWNLTYFKKKL